MAGDYRPSCRAPRSCGQIGHVLGGYKITGNRANDNVPFRSLIQLDIDSQVEKDAETGRVVAVTDEAAARPKTLRMWCGTSIP